MVRAEDGTVAICLHRLAGLPAGDGLERLVVAPQLESEESWKTLQLRATPPKTFDHTFLCQVRGLDACDCNKHRIQHRRTPAVKAQTQLPELRVDGTGGSELR